MHLREVLEDAAAGRALLAASSPLDDRKDPIADGTADLEPQPGPPVPGPGPAEPGTSYYWTNLLFGFFSFSVWVSLTLISWALASALAARLSMTLCAGLACKTLATRSLKTVRRGVPTLKTEFVGAVAGGGFSP